METSDQDGEVRWEAETSGSQDAYVSFSVRDGTIQANSWSCYRVDIDVDSGKIVSRVFTK